MALGAAVLIWGVAMVYQPAAFVVGGVLLCVIGFGLARRTHGR